MTSEIATAPHDEEPLEHPLVQERLDDLRAEFWVLRVDPPNVESSRTGLRVAPAHVCICPNCSIEEDTLLYGPGDIENALFCDSCFDDAHRAEIEAQLSKEMERDY